MNLVVLNVQKGLQTAVTHGIKAESPNARRMNCCLADYTLSLRSLLGFCLFYQRGVAQYSLGNENNMLTFKAI